MDILNMVLGMFKSASWTEIMSAAAVWVLAFRALADLTPSNSDNAIVAFLEKVFMVLGVKVPDVQAK